MLIICVPNLHTQVIKKKSDIVEQWISEQYNYEYDIKTNSLSFLYIIFFYSIHPFFDSFFSPTFFLILFHLLHILTFFSCLFGNINLYKCVLMYPKVFNKFLSYNTNNWSQNLQSEQREFTTHLWRKRGKRIIRNRNMILIALHHV